VQIAAVAASASWAVHTSLATLEIATTAQSASTMARMKHPSLKPYC